MTNVAAAVQPPKVAYVLKRFPRISETFILNEILELERLGVPVEIFALLPPTKGPHHKAVGKVQARVTYLPHNRVIKNLPMLNGCYAGDGLKEQPLKKVIPGPQTPAADLFPGKDLLETTGLLFKAAALTSAVWAKGIAHLHAHFGTDATTVAMLASRLSGIPYSFTAHAKDIFHTYTDRQVDTAFLSEKIRHARFVVTVSDYNRRYLAQLVGPGASAKISRLYNGIDLSRFHPNGAQRESGLIIAIGRLIEKKGFNHLINACRLVRERGCTFRCMIVGDGPDRHALEQQILELGLREHVTLIAALPQEQLVTMMQRAAVTVLPCVVSASGDRDGLPTVLLEALAAGLPAISTDIAGIPEIIDDGVSGLLVPPADPRRLADAIAELLSKPELQQRLARQGRVKAERDFDLRKNVRVLHDHFSRSATSPSNLSTLTTHENRLHHSG